MQNFLRFYFFLPHPVSKLSVGRVDPRVGLGWVGSGRVGSEFRADFVGRVGLGQILGGSGRVGSRCSGSVWVVFNFLISLINNMTRKSLLSHNVSHRRAM